MEACSVRAHATPRTCRHAAHLQQICTEADEVSPRDHAIAARAVLPRAAARAAPRAAARAAAPRAAAATRAASPSAAAPRGGQCEGGARRRELPEELHGVDLAPGAG